VKVLAEIPPRSFADGPPGRLRRRELDELGRVLEQLGSARSVLVTGSGPGRRALALGLATAAVAAGRKVALVECDLAEPTLADRLGLSNAPGVTEYLAGRAEIGRLLKPVVLAGPGSAGAGEPLVCVVAGRSSAEGPRLFATDEFATALAGLARAYELVVLDGPPIDDWPSLTLLRPRVAAAIACLGPGESERRLSIPVNGIVVEAERGATF
jgi:polysaccharide biosynthesis transport protein